MDAGHQLIRIRGDDRERSDPFAGCRLFPVLPYAANAEWRAVLHGDGVGLLCPLALDRLPLEKPIHRHDTAALPSCDPCPGYDLLLVFILFLSWAQNQPDGVTFLLQIMPISSVKRNSTVVPSFRLNRELAAPYARRAVHLRPCGRQFCG